MTTEITPPIDMDALFKEYTLKARLLGLKYHMDNRFTQLRLASPGVLEFLIHKDRIRISNFDSQHALVYMPIHEHAAVWNIFVAMLELALKYPE